MTPAEARALVLDLVRDVAKGAIEVGCDQSRSMRDMYAARDELGARCASEWDAVLSDLPDADGPMERVLAALTGDQPDPVDLAAHQAVLDALEATEALHMAARRNLSALEVPRG